MVKTRGNNYQEMKEIKKNFGIGKNTTSQKKKRMKNADYKVILSHFESLRQTLKLVRRAYPEFPYETVHQFYLSSFRRSESLGTPTCFETSF